jgi:hypothetical protein
VTAPAIDWSKLSKRQFEVLSQIAIGEDRGHNPRVLRALLDRGLIQEHKQGIYGQGMRSIDRIPVTVSRYVTPLWVHVEWAEYCDHLLTGEEPT